MSGAGLRRRLNRLRARADPVIKIAIEPRSKGDLEKMGNGLYKLAQEDPSFHYTRDEETNQTVIEGMGELHLDIIVDRLRREYKARILRRCPCTGVHDVDSALRAAHASWRQLRDVPLGSLSLRTRCACAHGERTAGVPAYAQDPLRAQGLLKGVQPDGCGAEARAVRRWSATSARRR